MKNILVPCDFSKTAINAFRFALDVAAQAKGKIYLVNVIELPVIQDPLIAPVMTFEQDYMTAWKTKITSDLDKLTTKYKSDVKVTALVEFGPVAKTITDFVEKNSIDLIIMGTHGASGLREFFIGSNAQKVVRHSTLPVLTIKHYYKGVIKDIVFPNTLETEDQEALTLRVKALQAFFKATLHILFINTPANFTSDAVTHVRLKQFARQFMFKDYTINICNDQLEEDGIISFASNIKGSIIAMGTSARKGIPHMIKGSVAESVVNHSDSIVWTYALNG